MSFPETELSECRRLKRQRNFFAACAVGCVAAVGLAVPRIVANYRELKRVNDRWTDVQQTIVTNQQHIRGVQAEIIKAQEEIARRVRQ